MKTELQEAVSSTRRNLYFFCLLKVFLCDPKDALVPDFSGECESDSAPEEMKRCNHVLAAWAFGSQVSGL